MASIIKARQVDSLQGQKALSNLVRFSVHQYTTKEGEILLSLYKSLMKEQMTSECLTHWRFLPAAQADSYR